MDDKVLVSLQTLITGFVVVFAMLLLLIAIIKIYGTIIYSIQNRNKNKKADKIKAQEPISTPKENVETFSNSLNGEIIAVISAAVDSMYGGSKVKIKSIKKSSSQKSAWRSAGVSNNTCPF